MKTLRSLTATILLLSAAFVLILTGCQKDELISPNAATPPPVDLASALNTNNSQPFQMISIDHKAGPTQAADYNVTVMSDGQIIFEGRKNVATIGIRTKNLTNDQMIKLQKYFEENNFEGIIQEAVSVDLATLSVAFKADKRTRVSTRMANENEGNRLSTFDNKLEDYLNIKAFTTSGHTDQSTFPIEHN